MNVTHWVKSFPRAQAANLGQRNDFVAEDFDLLCGVRAFDISGCTQTCVSDGSFIKDRAASANVEALARLREAARAMRGVRALQDHRHTTCITVLRAIEQRKEGARRGHVEGGGESRSGRGGLRFGGYSLGGREHP